MTPRSRTQRLNDKPMLPWAGIAMLIGALTTGGGLKLVDSLRPRTTERLGSIDNRLNLIERDLDGMTRAMWRAGIKPTTNEASR